MPATACRSRSRRSCGRGSASSGDHPLLICDDDVLTYADADARSAALAKGLLAIGAGRGTHVALLHPNGSDLVVGWLAAARIGAVTIPLSTFSTSGELRGLLRSADVEVLLATPSTRGRDLVAVLGEAVPGLDLSAHAAAARPRRPGPAARRVHRRARRRRRPDGPSRRCSTPAPRSTTPCSPPPRPRSRRPTGW